MDVQPDRIAQRGCEAPTPLNTANRGIADRARQHGEVENLPKPIPGREESTGGKFKPRGV
jgi:hypothetical protein